MKHLIFLFLLGLLFCTSCSVDDPIIEELEPAYYPVESKTVGRVLNQQGTPISDAIVELNGKTAITNSLGLFKFDKMELNGAGTNMIVRKLGYFNAYRTFIPNIPSISSVTVYMIERPPSASFQHNVGGTIGFSGGASVTILPNSVVDASGGIYTGEIQVTAYWLDPTDVNALSLMPGNLSGYSLEDEQVQLASYGMMVVELTSPAGEPLNIGNGQTATLVFPIGSDLLSSAPAVIPIWSFNESSGFWEEEGSANLTGTNYIAEVSHFSWWNCDAPFPVVEYEVCVLSEDGSPVSGAQVVITITSGNLTGRPLTAISYTDQNGKAFGKIPKDEALQLHILIGDLAAKCEFKEVYTSTIGPFSDPATSSITIGASLEARIIDFSGNFVNCDGDPVVDGVLLSSISDSAFPINADGTVDFSMVSCADDIEITVYDFEELKQSPTSTFITTQPVNDITLIDFEVCDNLDEFITLAYGSNDELYIPIYGPSGSFACWDSYGFQIGFQDASTSLCLVFETDVSNSIITGTFPALFHFQNNPEFLNGNVNVDVTSFTVPGYLEGNYSGIVYNGNSNVNVSGIFRVITQ